MKKNNHVFCRKSWNGAEPVTGQKKPLLTGLSVFAVFLTGLLQKSQFADSQC